MRGRWDYIQFWETLGVKDLICKLLKGLFLLRMYFFLLAETELKI